MKHRSGRSLLVALLFMCMFAMSSIAVSAATNMPVINVTVKKTATKKEATYKVGGKIKLIPHLSVKKTTNYVTYKSSKPAVASVSASGVVTLKAKGQTTITVTHITTKKQAKLVLKVAGSNTLCDLANQYGGDKGYFIHVNKSDHVVYILKRVQKEWLKYKAFPCCVGKPSTPTPSGLFSIKGRGLYFWTGSCKCWYYTQIVGGILFHSQIYSGASSPSYLVDGSMGVSCSHGCVRLHLSNAYWIYNNIPSGIKVLIF